MKPIVPPQKEGAKMDTIARRDFDNPAVAEQFFQRVRERFYAINQWQEVAGEGSAKFTLVDQNGYYTTAKPQVGFYFKINIPNILGQPQEKTDWVRVEMVIENTTATEELCEIRVRPCEDPFAPKEEADHFYTEEATSTFVINRVDKSITAEVHGRNEKPNPAGENIIEKVRNAVVGLVGIAGQSKVQWKLLTDGLLKDEAN